MAAATTGLLVPRALAGADSTTPSDFPVLTLAVGAELLAAEYYTQLLAGKRLNRRAVERARFNETEHYAAVAKLLRDAGQTPGEASDFDFTFPQGTFETDTKAARIGVELETTFLGIYLGGVATLSDSVARQVFARIAANQAQHLSFLIQNAGSTPIGVSFPSPLSIEDASIALDPYIS